MLKDNFCIVGIGQGGGKMAHEFYVNKYRSFFINTSNDDLSQLNIGNSDFIYQPPASKGCAKKREIARGYAKNYYDVMTEKLLDAHPSCGVFIVHYTLGGGTGGGLSNLFMMALRKKLNEMNKKQAIIIAVVARPRKYESYQMQKNATESLDELDKLLELGVVNQFYPINNDSRKTLKEINEEHYLLFDRWIEGETSNNQSNADESERQDLLSIKGQAMMFSFQCDSKNQFKKEFENAYNSSIYCFSRKNPKAIGLALNENIDEDVALSDIENSVGIFPSYHITPTSVSNMVFLVGNPSKEVKNSVVKIANAQAEKMKMEDDEEEVAISLETFSNYSSKSETEKDNSIDQEIANMNVEDLFNLLDN